MSAGLAFDAFVAFVNSNPPGSLNGAAKQRQSVGPGAASATSSAMPAGAVMAAAPPSLAAGPAPSQAPEIPSVTIDPETVSLVGGDQRQFNVAAEYADGSEDITSQVEWLSEPKGLISFDSYGLATTMPVSQTTTVTVIAKDPRTSKQAVSIVTLRAIPPDEPPKLQSITIEPSNPTIVAGKPLPFKAMGLFVSGDKKKSTHELTEGITWKSLLPDILSIDEHSGLASVVMPTRQNPPTVQIAVTETKTGKTGTTHVIVKVETVAETVLETITIEPQNLEINNGTRLQLKAWGVYSPGNWRQEETEAVDWSSSNDAAVWVDSKGTATALDVMPEVVTITATDPNSKKFGQTRLTVVNRHLKSISISPENAPVPQVGHTQFKAIGHYDKPYEPAVLDKIVWSSREPAIVFIDQEGKAVGQKPGTTLIKAYSPYWNSTGSTVVTVPDFKSINVFSDQPPAVGKKVQFGATGDLDDGTTRTLTGEIDWISSNPEVISIDKKTGAASVKIPGATTIEAKHLDSSLVGQSNITVLPTSPPGPLTQQAVKMLIKNLHDLASPVFQDEEKKTKPPQLQTAGEPSVDVLLSQAANVVRLWWEPKLFPSALATWRQIEPHLRALLKEAEEKLHVAAADLKPALDALAIITDFLSYQDSRFLLEEATNEVPTPEVTEAFDERELKKLGEALKIWKDVIALTEDLEIAEVKALEVEIKLYETSRSPKQLLALFIKNGFLGVDKELPDLVLHFGHECAMAAGALVEKWHKGAEAAEKAAKAALKAGNVAEVVVKDAEASVQFLEKWQKRVRLGGGVVGVYQTAIGLMKLIPAINEGNWKEIAEGGESLAMGAIGLAEVAGGIGAGTAAVATIVVWAAVEGTILAIEKHKWHQKVKALQAFKNLGAAARKIIPDGKRMSAAVELKHSVEASMDPVDSANYKRFDAQARAAAEKVVQGIRTQLLPHFNNHGPDFVGGYPELVDSVLPMINEVYSKVDENPETIVTAFEVTGEAIKMMIRNGDAAYGDADEGEP